MSVKDIVKNLKQTRHDFRRVIKAGVLATANEVRNIAVTSIQNQSAGDTVKAYKQGGRSYMRVVSRAGDAPNTDTGRLVQSLAVQMDANDYKAARVGTDVKYATALEFGTRNMKARPFLYPALEKAKQDDLLAKNIKKAAAHYK